MCAGVWVYGVVCLCVYMCMCVFMLQNTCGSQVRNLEESFFSVSQLGEPPSYWLMYRAQVRTDSQVTPEHLYHSKSRPMMDDDLMETASWSPAFS